MSIFIKTGYWEKAYKGLKGWLNIDTLIKDIVDTYSGSSLTPDEVDAIQASDSPSASNPLVTESKLQSEISDLPFLKLDQSVQQSVTGAPVMEAIDFDLDSDIANTKGRLKWDGNEETLSFGVEGGSIDINKEIFDYFTDLSVGGLVEGDVVSVTGISGNRQGVNLTDCTSRNSATACIGMVTYVDHKVRVTKKGRVRDLDTRTLTEGLPIYVDPLNPGKYTQTPPTAPNYFIHVGIVEVAANKGIIDVDVRVVYAINDLSNVKITTPSAGQVLMRDATNQYWENVTPGSIIRGTYRYDAQSLTADTIGDWRTYSDANGFYTQYCTVANATKGAGTWITKLTIPV